MTESRQVQGLQQPTQTLIPHPVVFQRNPSDDTDKLYSIGQIWVNDMNGESFIKVSNTPSKRWIELTHPITAPPTESPFTLANTLGSNNLQLARGDNENRFEIKGGLLFRSTAADSEISFIGRSGNTDTTYAKFFVDNGVKKLDFGSDNFLIYDMRSNKYAGAVEYVNTDVYVSVVFRGVNLEHAIVMASTGSVPRDSWGSPTDPIYYIERTNNNADSTLYLSDSFLATHNINYIVIKNSTVS